jgi:hypothetical protein
MNEWHKMSCAKTEFEQVNRCTGYMNIFWAGCWMCHERAVCCMSVEFIYSRQLLATARFTIC